MLRLSLALRVSSGILREPRFFTSEFHTFCLRNNVRQDSFAENYLRNVICIQNTITTVTSLYLLKDKARIMMILVMFRYIVSIRETQNKGIVIN